MYLLPLHGQLALKDMLFFGQNHTTELCCYLANLVFVSQQMVLIHATYVLPSFLPMTIMQVNKKSFTFYLSDVKCCSITHFYTFVLIKEFAWTTIQPYGLRNVTLIQH